MKKSKAIGFDPAEYDHMDKMPLGGWFWEMIRRGVEYRQEFDELQGSVVKQVSALSKNKEVDERWLTLRIEELMERHIKRIQEIGVHIDWRYPLSEPNSDHYLVISCGNNVLMIPRPEIKYSEFVDLKPSILGLESFSVSTMDDLEELVKPINLTPGAPPECCEVEIPSAKECLETLSPTIPEQTIYIGLSSKAKVEDIENRLLSEIKKLLDRKKPRIRDDKWKYYLITYDLRAISKYKFGEISDVLYAAYRLEELADERTVNRYYKEALALIAGGYKEYLYL